MIRNFTQLTLLISSALVMILTIYLIFIWVPTDDVLGVSQRIFYFHVPIGILGLMAFPIVFIGSITYLITKNQSMDSIAYSAAEIGALFLTIALITGMLWSKPSWGVWWTWSPQPTLTLVSWLVYMAYIMLRAYSPRGNQGAKYAAVLGIIGSVNSIFVYLAAKIWRDVHPEAVLGPLAEDNSLDPSMQIGLLIALTAFSLLFLYLISERFLIRKTEQKIERLQYELD
jgi:heme exporter protein C